VPPTEQNLIVGIFGISKKGVPFGCLGAHIRKEPASDKKRKRQLRNQHYTSTKPNKRTHKTYQVTLAGALCMHASS
jgi:hypothetical protein